MLAAQAAHLVAREGAHKVEHWPKVAGGEGERRLGGARQPPDRVDEAWAPAGGQAACVCQQGARAHGELRAARACALRLPACAPLVLDPPLLNGLEPTPMSRLVNRLAMGAATFH